MVIANFEFSVSSSRSTDSFKEISFLLMISGYLAEISELFRDFKLTDNVKKFCGIISVISISRNSSILSLKFNTQAWNKGTYIISYSSVIKCVLVLRSSIIFSMLSLKGSLSFVNTFFIQSDSDKVRSGWSS